MANTKRIVTNIDGVAKEFNTDSEFIEYVKAIYTENESGQPYDCELHWLPENIIQALEYVNEYCPALTLTTN